MIVIIIKKVNIQHKSTISSVTKQLMPHSCIMQRHNSMGDKGRMVVSPCQAQHRTKQTEQCPSSRARRPEAADMTGVVPVPLIEQPQQVRSIIYVKSMLMIKFVDRFDPICF